VGYSRKMSSNAEPQRGSTSPRGGGSHGSGTPRAGDGSLRAGGGSPTASPRNAGSPNSPQIQEDIQSKDTDVLAASDFKPEVLHVRALILEARRGCAREVVHVRAELSRKQGMLNFMGRGDPNSSGIEYSSDTIEDQVQNLESDMKRLKYTERLIQLRQQRLEALNPFTFVELPQQLVPAAHDGDTSYVRLIAEARVSVDLQDKRGMTPLIAASVNNKVSTVRLLLELHADANLRDQNGATCAHYAVQLDRAHIVNALLEMNAGEHWDSFTVKDQLGRSAVDYAKQQGRGPMRQLLRARIGGGIHMLIHISKGKLLDDSDEDWRSNGGNWFSLCPCSTAATLARERERIAAGEKKRRQRRPPGA